MKDDRGSQDAAALKRWERSLVQLEKQDFAASMVPPDTRALFLFDCNIPDGELRKLAHLEYVCITGGSAQSIDLRGCDNLQFLQVRWMRGLTQIAGLEDLTSLEILDLYALPRMTTTPSLERLTNLWWVAVGSMKRIESGLAPFLAAPNLRELKLASTFIAQDEDAALLRDHLRVVGVTWWPSRGIPRAKVTALIETAGRRNVGLLSDGRPPESEKPPTPLAILKNKKNKLTFRTVLGGPAVPRAFNLELRRIQTHLKSVAFEYDLDMYLNIGGNLIPITESSGLKIPRVYLSKKRVTASILLNSEEVLSAQDPRGLLRSVIHQSVCEVIDRVAARDKTFDKGSELAKLDFLTSQDWSSPENIEANTPDEPIILLEDDDPRFTDDERKAINAVLSMGVKFPD